MPVTVLLLLSIVTASDSAPGAPPTQADLERVIDLWKDRVPPIPDSSVVRGAVLTTSGWSREVTPLGDGSFQVSVQATLAGSAELRLDSGWLGYISCPVKLQPAPVKGAFRVRAKGGKVEVHDVAPDLSGMTSNHLTACDSAMLGGLAITALQQWAASSSHDWSEDIAAALGDALREPAR